MASEDKKEEISAVVSDIAQAAPVEKKNKPKAKPTVSLLENIGVDAISRHGFQEVFVTSDGLVFPLHNDAQQHAADLAGKTIIKVTKS